MKKKDFDYFGYFCAVADNACKAALFLDESLRHYNSENFPNEMREMHRLENDSDSLKHEMVTQLLKEFIAPIEREDILALAHQLDNVIDAIDSAMRHVYMYRVEQIRPDVAGFTGLIVQCTQSLRESVEEFRNFRSSKTIREKIIAVTTLETQGDDMYADCIRTLFGEAPEAHVLFGWNTVYEELEFCLDSCDHAARIIESVMMKNS
ncbi:MAG: DUF47 family protein [Oscillospiraceae bacterium]|jgi:uncharacterized protein Yka (UPF0111/DUF47 family)|nr:DUF47 family protein [Oscillospiraceae bacterium]